MTKLPLHVADWSPFYRELVEERAGIIEFDANCPRSVAEREAVKDIRKQAEWEDAT